MSEADDATLIGPGGGSKTLSPGSTFAGRYQIERELGRGGMGAVYLVLDTELGEKVALKLLEGGAKRDDAIERFRREVRLARRVTHRNVARTYDIGESDGAHYLTMEYVQGGLLFDVCKGLGAMGEDAGRFFATQMLDTMEFMFA